MPDSVTDHAAPTEDASDESLEETLRGKRLNEADALLAARGLRRWVSMRSPEFASFLWGAQAGPIDLRLTRWVFLRSLGVIWLIAFLSLWVQVKGLIGPDGLLPAGEFLNAAHESLGAEALIRLPTVFWLSAGNAALSAACLLGTLLSVCLIIGVAPVFVLMALWALYLSVLNVGQDFLSFQWDILLLETTFLAIFLAPLQLPPSRLSREAPVPRCVVFLLRLLLFKLMFSSGITKLTWDDPTWWNLTALAHHFESQPLPVVLSWYAHHLPDWFLRVSCFLMFVIEIVVPFLIFAPRRLRAFAVFPLTALMLLIGITGNYNFFNLLAVALCVLLLDDAVWPRRLREALMREPPPERPPHRGRWSPWITVPLAVIIVALNIPPLIVTLNGKVAPSALRPLAAGIENGTRLIAPLRLANSYGLFRVMTTRRLEILIEGSDDGETWLPIEFQWKPGDVSRHPGWAQPHQPRLDWQMWFASLSVEQGRLPRWILSLRTHLLEGTPEVLALLGPNPFPESPPQWIRVSLSQYRFTEPVERAQTGDWWKSQGRLIILPPTSLPNETQSDTVTSEDAAPGE
jgi:hypothetical protein